MNPPRTDPLTALGHDCFRLTWEHLSIYDVVKCERVSKEWKQAVLCWITSRGLRKHFPDIWEIAVCRKRGDDEKRRMFMSEALEQYCRDTLIEGNVTDASMYETKHMLYPGENFIVWTENINGTAGLFAQKFGLQENGQPYPGRFIPTTADLHNFQDVDMNENGLLLIIAPDLRQRGLNGTQRNLYMISLEEGRQLWTREDDVDNTLPYPIGAPFAFAQEGFYQFGKDGVTIKRLDPQTGDLLNEPRLTEIEPPCYISWVPIANYKLGLALDRMTGPAHVSIIDPGLGSVMQRVPVTLWEHPKIDTLQTDGYARDPQFAVVSSFAHGDFLMVKIEKFVSDMQGEFHHSATEILGNGPDVVFPLLDIDPFSRIVTGIFYQSGTPGIAEIVEGDDGQDDEFWKTLVQRDPSLQNATRLRLATPQQIKAPVHTPTGITRVPLEESPPFLDKNIKDVELAGKNRILVTTEPAYDPEPPVPDYRNHPVYLLDFGVRQS
ncbi:uncharacterized protein BDV14DRAFT_198245 [Aspergillus stella-maris]|uniref:uncharacterized protein n=1 Tax=Aspergillus stella-maris TaxID=1810926 RepID=UPI003CCE2868